MLYFRNHPSEDIILPMSYKKCFVRFLTKLCTITTWLNLDLGFFRRVELYKWGDGTVHGQAIRQHSTRTSSSPLPSPEHRWTVWPDPGNRVSQQRHVNRTEISLRSTDSAWTVFRGERDRRTNGLGLNT